MKKILFATIILIIILACNKTASASASTDDEIVATWRGGQITLKEFEDLLINNDLDIEDVNNSSFNKKREILDYIINLKLTSIVADSLKLDTVKTIQEAYKTNLYRIAYNQALFLDSVHNKIVTPDLIQRQYNLMKYKYNVSHILTNDKESIDSIYRYLIKNPDSFLTFAKENSLDRNNGKDGGNLGWNLLTNFVPAFSETITTLEIGEISKPFKSQYGWHIAKINDIRANEKLGSIENETKNIRQTILTFHKEQFDSINNEWENFLIQKYNVSVDSHKVNEFVKYYNSLEEKGVSTACDESYYKTDIILSTFKSDTIYVKNALNNISRWVSAAINMNKDIPELTSDNIYGLIFATYFFEIRKLITEELGYTKRADIIQKAKNLMLYDFKDYLIKKPNLTRDQENQWFEPYRKFYNLSIDYIVFENAFYYPADNKK